MAENESNNFIEQIIEDDLKQGKYDSIVTRFPPEPNGYLHIGHASSICLNFGLTERFEGYTNLRFDDTNPSTEDTSYVESIKRDIRWLGFEWKNELYASDYFDTLYDYAIQLINDGLAYVDDSTSEEMAAMKGTHTEPGTNSPFRDRSIADNLKLFEDMKAGNFADGSKTLRAKIDMAHINMLMRDPIIYRIKKISHHRTGDTWNIYPMYDFAHGQSDSIEHITHSLCTMEFVPHRELYDWFIQKLNIYPSHQYEFARRNINYTITSKRKLLQLVEQNYVDGWDDPRMPTISGMRRRGMTPESIRTFCDRIGIGKRENLVDIGLLEHLLREDLNEKAHRRMGVLDPLKLVITNYPADREEILSIENRPLEGDREVPFSNELWIEREDFKEEAEKKWFRLAPNAKVRLKGAYIIECEDYIKNDAGEIVEVRAKYYPESKSGQDTSGIKVKGIIHWVSTAHAVPARVNIYDRLFSIEDPASQENYLDYLNPDSLEVKNAFVEPILASEPRDYPYQFIRLGYFIQDEDSSPDNLIFNRTVSLRDSWSKIQNKK